MKLTSYIYRSQAAIQIPRFSLIHAGLAHQDADSDLIKLTPNKLQSVMVLQNITITCVTRNSSIMAWTSEEYIGEGGRRLEFLIINEIGSIHMSVKPNSTAFANLTTLNVNQLMLASQLHITVSRNYPQFNVTCHNSDYNLTKSVTYIVGKTL